MGGGGAGVSIGEPGGDRRGEQVVFPRELEDGLGAVRDIRQTEGVDEVAFEVFPEGVVGGLETLDDGFRDGLAIDFGEFRAILGVLVVCVLKLQMFEAFSSFS